MKSTRRPIVVILACLGVWAPASKAEAACCSGFTQQCAGTKSVWCVQDAAPAGTLPNAFCAYGDQVVTELETLFNVPAPGTFEFDVEWPANGGAHTGTDCSTFGDGVTGDAFTNNSYGVTGFYGYLLALHEAINDWTGLSSGGWPTDYWADHVSGFPNEMDWRIMGTLGASLSDTNLQAASVAQKARFWPGGDSEDSRVQMFDDIFTLPKMGDGYDGFKRIFSYVQGDKISWDSVANNGANPDQRRSEYVAAYLSLGAGESVLPIQQTPHAGYAADKSWKVCNGQWDGQSGDPNPSYTCSEANIDAIATAHCSIAANGNPSADLSQLQAGTFSGIKSGPCGSTCPSECACKTSTNECVAPWLGDAPPNDAGASGGSDASTGGGSKDGGKGGGTADSGSGPSPADGGSGTGQGGGDGSEGGVVNPPGGSGSGGGTGNGATGSGGSSSGCGCTTAGDRGTGSPLSALFGGSALAALVLVRKRAKRR
jgi:MYXO-CTERM domain-containing protein